MRACHSFYIYGLTYTTFAIATISVSAVEISSTSPRSRAAAAVAANTVAAAAAVTPPPAEPSRIRVRYREGSSAAAAVAAVPPEVAALVARASDARVQSVTPATDKAQTFTLDKPVSEEEIRIIAQSIESADNVLSAVPEKIERAHQAVANDPHFAAQWHYHQEKIGIRLPQAWHHSTGAGVVVAVLDTGIRNHADIASQVINGFDMITSSARSNDGDGRDPDATDPGDWCTSDAVQMSSWHGLHVAGTIAAITNNNIGVSGIARNATILPVRVLGQCGGSSLDIADGIRWAAGIALPGVPSNPNPARVINLSLGGSGPCDSEYAEAIQEARQRGATIVVSAGNSDTDAINSRPANCEGVISVASTNRDGARSFFGRAGAGSNFGATVKIAAPGGETFSTQANGILSTLNDGLLGPGKDSYEAYQGTSMAAPHVSGVVAMMYQVHPSITPDEVLGILRSTSQAFPKVSSRQCTTATCGAGIINAEAAVAEAVRRGSRPSLSPSASATTGNRTIPLSENSTEVAPSVQR